MLQELEEYYEKHGILSTAFTCKYKNSCKGDCREFTGPKSAFVSSGYAENILPRLLFLSLDSGSGDLVYENRLPAAVRQQNEIDTDVLTLPKHKHWYRTNELAWYIFKEFKLDIKIEEAKGYFAHANSAKCCMNKEQRKKADSNLFKNCKRYLKSELQILKPEIIVTQGNEAKIAIASLGENTISRIDEFASIVILNGNQVFWLHTHHPNNWGAFNKQRNFDKAKGVAVGWTWYSSKMQSFVASKRHNVVKTRSRNLINYNSGVALSYAEAAFNSILRTKGLAFGAKNSKYKGFSDGQDGVQWNIAVNNESAESRLGVNLEGLKYVDWPIATFLENEMKNPCLPSLSDIPDAHKIHIGLYRDAWQAAARLRIKQGNIIGSGSLLADLTEETWYEMLKEAYTCLAPDKKHRGRQKQVVTLIKSGKQVEKQISPHLTIYMQIWASIPISEKPAASELQVAFTRLSPIYEFAKRQSRVI